MAIWSGLNANLFSPHMRYLQTFLCYFISDGILMLVGVVLHIVEYHLIFILLEFGIKLTEFEFVFPLFILIMDMSIFWSFILVLRFTAFRLVHISN